MVAWSGACAVSDGEPPQGEGSTTDGVTASEECQAAAEAVEDTTCAPGLSFLYYSGDDVADWAVVSPDEARIELPHGYLLESGAEHVVIGEAFVHNEQCIGGCLVGLTPGHDLCVGVDANGDDVCSYIGASDVEACEAFTNACAGG